MNIGKFKIKLVIFDMDGVLFDSERLSKELYNRAFMKFGYIMDSNIFDETIGMSIKSTDEIYRKFYGEGFPFGKIREEKLKMEREFILSNGVLLKEGLHELLDYLKKKKLKMALATSAGRVRTELLLDSSGIKKYFNATTCGDEIKRSKPEPDIFLETAKKVNCKPENCVVLEDSKNGITAAYRAGMLAIMVPDMVEPAEEIKKMLFKKFNNLREVKDYFSNSSDN
jgi:HAD superfamily hydrolase (TIGR01509 family)